MKTYQANNWCGNDPLELRLASVESISKYGPLIHIAQYSGGMTFNHTITPNQARNMAQALLDIAAEAEAESAALNAKVAA